MFEKGLIALIATALAVSAACSSGTPVAARPAHPFVPAAAAALPGLPAQSAAQSPSPAKPATATVPRSSTTVVNFSDLKAGTYPVHIHSRCDGRQSFHITVVQSLRVGAGGSGSIGVPSSYFGRGLCLIVYATPSLYAVLTTRPI